jgi:(p)ppGpp synthase/HD superfamily hydrolase
MYTYKIEQAIKAAALLHQDQLRKGDVGLPYISHLVAVMMILRDYTQDEDILVAALLHDTLEDTDYTLEELKEDFGDTVAKYVVAVTEPTPKEGEKIPWMDKKKLYAKQIKDGPIEAVMIAAADKTHNLRTMVEDYMDDHDGFLRDFGNRLDDRMEAYQSIANAINSRLDDGIVHEFNNTFSAYKDFLIDVQENLEKVE